MIMVHTFIIQIIMQMMEAEQLHPEAGKIKELFIIILILMENLKYLDEFEAQMSKADFDNVISDWKTYTTTLNRHVRIVTHRKGSRSWGAERWRASVSATRISARSMPS